MSHLLMNMKIVLTVDSGASETVLRRTTLAHVKTTESEAQRRGTRYEVANGEIIENEGEKKFAGYIEDGAIHGVRAQVCDVNRDLLSVSRVVKGGNMVAFHPLGSFVQDLHTHERTWLREDSGTYTLSLWVRNQPF